MGDLMGTVRFVGEIQGRKGIYYGIELTEAKGKSNGTVGNVRYFKCKNKRGLFLRFARIQEVIANDTIHRIGINDCIELYAGNRKSVGVVRYIGIPPRCKEVYYGLQFRKPIGDNDGVYHGTRYFTTSKKCAYFVKASSSHIVKIENDTNSDNNNKGKPQQQQQATQMTPNGSNNKQIDHKQQKNKNKKKERQIIKNIQLDIYCDDDQEQNSDQPIFTITVLSNFSFNDLVSSISKMSQYVSSVFEIRFEPIKEAKNGHHANGHNGHHNGHNKHRNGNIHKKVYSILNEEQLRLLRIHSFNFYEYGKFFVIEPLKKGIILEENGCLNEALAIYHKYIASDEESDDKQSTEALTYYANCLVLLDKFDEAEIFYKRALDINPFCGDICYFYSRLLEYRDKYDEAKNLCNRIMSYVKSNKSSLPAGHHPIHYGCYARLGTKYVKLSLDRYNRSKMNVQQKLDRYINEKKQLQQRIDDGTNIKKLNELNQSIQKLEKQLLRNEAIIKDKDKQLITKQNEIKLLKNEINLIKNEKEKESAAKILSQNKINDDVNKLEIQKKSGKREER